MRRILIALVALGVVLRAIAYLGNTSLWLDEILLGRNIIELPMRELLFAPLALDQVAPRGFLFFEKLAVLAFGPGELALRLFPFLSAVAGVVLFRKLAERTLTGWAVPIAVALFVVAIPSLKYGAEVKQYHADATAAILVALLAMALVDSPPTHDTTRRRLAIGGAGFILICFSQAAVLVMAGIGLAIAIEWAITRRVALGRVLVTTIALWAVASVMGIAMGVGSMSPSTRQFMQEFWQSGFAPLPLSSALPFWYWARMRTLFEDPALLGYPWPLWFLLLMIAGAATLWRERRVNLLIILAPIAMTLAAATAQQYPFRQRLAFFLVPFALLLVASGVEWLRCLVSRVHWVGGVAPVALTLGAAAFALATTRPPYDLEHHRDVLRHLQQHRQPGDLVYVFPLTRIGVLFYGPQYGLAASEFITAACDPSDTRAYLRDADRLRAHPRVWMISAGVRPFRAAREAVRNYLDAIGTRRDSVRWPSLTMTEVTLDLYDLADPVRLTGASAETFPVSPMPTDPRPGCRPWTRPDAFALR